MASPTAQNPDPNPNADSTPNTESNITTAQDILQGQIEHTRHRVPIRTYHCSFCKHLLIATTHDIASLPRRKAPALDNAIILPLPEDTKDDEEEEDDDGNDDDDENDKNNGQDDTQQQQHTARKNKNKDTKSKHYTILLSTTSPDRKPIILRRSDGFEKRLLVRCGRCRVVLGYVLDEVHFGKGIQPQAQTQAQDQGQGQGQGENKEGGANSTPGVIYVLPGAVTETGELEKEILVEREEWSGWEELGKS